jgi:hypothetical protein
MKSMATTRNKTTAPPAEFLTTAAQAIGSTLGQLAKKVGVASPAPAKPAPKKKPATAKKKVVVKKKAAKKKAK